jgi:diketogulonate reductase-like aldo/keto reductase
LWKGLIRASQDGLAKDIGVSNYSAERIDALIQATGAVGAQGLEPWTR